MQIRNFAKAAARRGAGMLAGLVGFAAALTVSAQAPADWKVADATLRFTVKLTGAPTHPSAGYFINLPDGGLLPGPAPVTAVFAASAEGLEPVESYQLWHSPDSSLSIVFADPGSVENVHIYVSGREDPVMWAPDTELTPSTILCVDPTQASLPAAKQLAARGATGPTVHARNKSGVKQAPLSIGGDDSGRPRPASFYLLSHVVTTDPGKTWIAPFSLDGITEVYVDGALLTPQQRIDKWGGKGAYFDLDAGLHRIEVLQTAEGTEAYSSHRTRGGLMYLTWRPPNATMEELGGVRSKKVPLPGTSRMETRILNPEEIARSGSCTVAGGVTREGAPLACMQILPTHGFWFEGEDALVSYEMRALNADHPRDTRYTWTFPGGLSVQRSAAFWLYPGFQENRVKLSATSKSGTTQSVQPFFGYANTPTDLSKADHRQAFRTAMEEMLEATAANTDSDPVAEWGPGHWNNLIRITELGKGYTLLRNLFSKRLDIVRAALGPEQQVLLENVFLDMAQRRNPQEALKSVDQLIAGSDEQRRSELLIRKSELLVYYLDQGDTAKAGLTRLAEEDSEMGEWARIRLGDMAFLGGDINEATQYYADVQNRAREKRNRPEEVEDAASDDDDAVEGAPADSPDTPDDPAAKPGADPADPADPAPDPADAPQPRADWNVTALLDVSNAENIESLIEGDYLLEAQHALRSWERELPLSKISGDFLIIEAKYYMALGDYLRARALLTAYCREIDASSFLPDAVRLLIQSVEAMEAPREDIRDIIENVKGNLKFHPVADELDAFLAGDKKE